MSQGALYNAVLHDLLRKAAEAYRRHDDPVFRALLEEAVMRTPHRLDLRISLANHCIQTGLTEQALDIYEELTRMVPRDVDVLFALAHWRRHQGDADGAVQARKQLAKIRSEKAADLLRLWQTIDAWQLRQPTDRLPTLPSSAIRKAVLTLGYVLADDGSIRPELTERLVKASEAAERFPDAALVLSGGVPKSDRVEAVAMGAWLRERGVAAERIYEEGYSRDLVENIIYSRQILDLLDIDAVLVITSAANYRRAGAVLETVAHNSGSAWLSRVVAASGQTFSSFKDNGGDQLKLYRDVLRAYGCPMMVVYPELVER